MSADEAVGDALESDPAEREESSGGEGTWPARVIAGHAREKAQMTRIPAVQNRTKYPKLHRPEVIAGQSWRYPPRMTRNEKTAARGAGQSAAKHRNRAALRGLPPG